MKLLPAFLLSHPWGAPHGGIPAIPAIPAGRPPIRPGSTSQCSGRRTSSRPIRANRISAHHRGRNSNPYVSMACRPRPTAAPASPRPCLDEGAEGGAEGGAEAGAEGGDLGGPRVDPLPRGFEPAGKVIAAPCQPGAPGSQKLRARSQCRRSKRAGWSRSSMPSISGCSYERKSMGSYTSNFVRRRPPADR